MWSNALKFIGDIYRGARCTQEERTAHATTVTRLRKSPSAQAYWTDKVEESSDAKATLFGAMRPGLLTHMPERKAVGHWFKMTVPNERDKHFKLTVRSYDADFRPGFGLEDTNFEQYVTASERQKALKRYIIAAQVNQPSSSSQSDRRSLPVPMPHISKAEIGGYSQSTDFWMSDQNNAFSETEEMMIRLAQDEDESVRCSVASNEHAPVAVLWLLSEDESNAVKLALMSNIKCPIAILDKLAKDLDGRVSRKAKVKLRAVLSEEVGIASGNLSIEKNQEEHESAEDNPEALAV